MASSLNIIVNHKFQFEDPEYVIKQFENLLNTQVVDCNRKDLHIEPKTEKFNEAKYYVSQDSLLQNFENWNYVEILSNYKPLYNFKIFKKTILIFTNLMIKYWRPLLEGETYDNSLLTQYQHTTKFWNLIQENTKTIVNKLNESQVLYLSDEYDNISDLCYQGNHCIPDLINVITMNYSSTQLKWINESDMKKRLRFNWLNLIINENNKWVLNEKEI